MMELSFCGAEVLHWRSVEVARRFGVKVNVRSTFGKELGTIVTRSEEIEAHDVTGITQDLNLVRIKIPCDGEAQEKTEAVLRALEAAEVNVRFLHIPAAAVSSGFVSVMIPEDQKEAALEHLEPDIQGHGFDVDERLGIVAIVGQGLCSKPGMAGRVLASLESLGIKPDLISTSGITMTMLLEKGDVLDAVRRLHTDLL
jgi:aspartate kinase